LINHKSALLLVALLVSLACGNQSSGNTNNQPYVIGVSGYLSGPGDNFYVGQAEGIRVYFDALNSRGGINGHPVKILFRDDGGDPAKSAANAQSFISSNVSIASLASFSSAVPGFAAATTQAGLPVVNPYPCYGPSVPGGGASIASNYFCAGITGVGDGNALVKVYEETTASLGLRRPTPIVYGSSDAPGNL